MAWYTNITQGEIEEFLFPQGFQPLLLPGVKELVYAKRVDTGHQLSLRIYTGINPDGNSRDVGKDAIRPVVFWRSPEGQIVKLAKAKRVHRVSGWRANLQKRIDNFRQDISPLSCPACDSPMVARKGSKGVFYGCARYPVCKKTREA